MTYIHPMPLIVLTAMIPISAAAQGSMGSFVGDCFQFIDPKTQDRQTLLVTDQKPNGADMQLTTVPGEVSFMPIPGQFGCKPSRPATAPEPWSLADLTQRAPRRYGWAYGALTMPYKYYPGAKEFQVGVPIGGYLGYRIGQAGSGYTLAGALTLSQVKANTLDPKTLNAEGKPTVTGTTDLAALSWAVGLVFDVSKDPRTKAFKAGLFVGQDRVNESASVSYKHNGKTYVALQLGFDFTD